MYRNQNSVNSYGYKEQVNLISDNPLIGPYVEIQKIVSELKKILEEKMFTEEILFKESLFYKIYRRY